MPRRPAHHPPAAPVDSELSTHPDRDLSAPLTLAGGLAFGLDYVLDGIAALSRRG